MSNQKVSAAELRQHRETQVGNLVGCPGCPELTWVDPDENDGCCWYHGRDRHAASNYEGHDHA